MGTNPWENFTYAEFACACCNNQSIHPPFISRLQRLRDEYKKPMRITSGFRCKDYDEKLGGKGAHQSGHAADMLIPGEDIYHFLALAFEHGFTGIGVKAHGDVRFVHLDDLKHGDWVKKRPFFWTYR